MKKLATLFLVLIMLVGILPMAMAENPAPTKLTWGSVNNLADFSQFEIIQELCAKMNIELEFTEFDYDAFSVMLADGSFPDIMSTRIEFLDSVLKSGYALNIEPYIDEYLYNMKNPLYVNTNKDTILSFFPIDIVSIDESQGIYIFRGFDCGLVGIHIQSHLFT